MANPKAIRSRLFLVVFNLVVAIGLLEGLFVLMLNVPRVVGASPRPLRRLIQQLYRHFDRGLIQFDSVCAQYDPEVTYTLKPGACTFGNVEFQNEYRINRLGLRDDDAALDAPEIIVVGDSHAMGWGVDQDESLVRVLARNSGLRVLNAAISSYGTVRERLLLDRLDTSRLAVLVIQYSDNDLPENRAFLEHDGHLPIASQAEYQKIVRYYASQRSYYPAKYVFRLFMKVSRLEEPEPDALRMEPVLPVEEAQIFLSVLERAGRAPLDNVQVIVFEVNEQLTPPRPFIAALDEVRRRVANPPFIRRLMTLDTTRVLTPRDFYVLDDHMNARGHRMIGEALSDLVRNRVGSGRRGEP